MRISVTNAFTNDGKEYYKWDLWSGPDGIEHVHGFATDLITAFSKVLEWQERIGADYAQVILADIETAKQFLTTEPNNETLD
jgi:hypothetical protein